MGRSLALLSLLAVLFCGAAAAKPARVALVIGNAQYVRLPELATPTNDAQAMTERLSQLGFHVYLGTDLDLAEMRSLINRFANMIDPWGGMALFYYAGHAFQHDGRNYLLPVDSEVDTAELAALTSVELQWVLSSMEGRADTRVVILDASRDNGFVEALARRSGAPPSLGLAPVDARDGSFIAFSTQPGNVALDGEGRNSPFTEALVSHIDAPGEDIHAIMRRIRADVQGATGGTQIPWENSSLVPTLYLAPLPIEAKSGNPFEERDPPAAPMAPAEQAFRHRGPTLWSAAATRMFTGPHAFPPPGFGAYGIVVFPAAPTPATAPRFTLVCNAFVSAFDPSRSSSVAQAEQMVTVWPVATDHQASALNGSPRGEQCAGAVESYDAATARQARRNAASAGRRVIGKGPFLFAWAPSDRAGNPDVPVLVVDMSGVETETQAREVFDFWKHEIEDRGFIWRHGWNFELIRLRIKFTADNAGRIFFDGGG